MSEALYRLLLKLYPAAFRREYEAAMRQLFRDRLRAERSGPARLRLWTDVLRDLASSLPREHRRRLESIPASSGYRMSEEAVRRMHSGGQTLGAVLGLSLGLGLGILGNAPRWPLTAACSLFALTIPWSVHTRRRIWRHWRGYELNVDGERLEVRQYGAATVTLHRTEITKMAESPGGHGFPGGLVIRGEGNREIWAPSVLTRYEELRERLAGWAPIDPLPARGGRARFARLGHFAGIGGLWLYPTALLVRSPWVFFPLAALIGAPLAYATARLLRTKGVPAFAKAIPAVLLAVLLVKLALFAR
jgi:hypothetical protein